MVDFSPMPLRRMNRVFIKTYGCQMNERDSEAVAAMLRARGYRIVGNEDDCDILLLNTCSVRDTAEQKAIGKASNLLARKRHQPDFILGILGCMAQNRGAELLDRLPDVDLIVGTQKFHQVPGHLDNLRAARAAGAPVGSTIVDIAEEPESQNTIRDHLETPERQVTAFVSIQQGCDMNCAFCIVPKTRGDERSRPMDAIVAECRALVERGVREITLLGQIVTSYGRRDYAHTGGVSAFVRLLERVHAIDGIERIRFTSPHPRGFKQDLVDAFGRLPKLGDYVHLPVQSGSNRILKAMKRPYTRERYLEIIQALRAVRPDMYFSTDVIVGFPGETEEDFAETRSLFEAVNYDMAYVFKYSIRTGTPAADMAGQVPEEVKEERNRILLELLQENSVRRNQTLIGSVQEVLIEGPDKTGRRFTGRTRGNRVAVFEAAPRLVGSLAPLKVTRASVSTLYGELELAGGPGLVMVRPGPLIRFSCILHEPFSRHPDPRPPARRPRRAAALLRPGRRHRLQGLSPLPGRDRDLLRLRRHLVPVPDLEPLPGGLRGVSHVLLFFGFGIVAVLAFKCIPDFLAVRGACVLVLLAAGPLLGAAYMEYGHPRRLFMVKALVYIGIALAIWLGAQPYRLRDFFGWLFARPGRARGFGALLAAYGLLLCAVAFTYK